jgi:NADH-quinone oxidoreductase subunit G
MSAQPTPSTPAATASTTSAQVAQSAVAQTLPDHVNIEIDGKAMQVPKGSMIIQAADKIGVKIPRFCYHDKLPIAANCRMCLVEVEKAPKPQPACATPVMEGMKIHTQSQRSLSAQRNVMEFLLINHPLDCPICDQGGECELQDVAMGYGRSVSRFTEDKRVVADEDLGPLVATEMTRCIHCTRCVRFMDEIAGTTELGGMGRGETLEIGTYIGRAIKTELSGNIIDVCPVGALTNKVFRFKARPWELTARASIGYHDSLHSSLYIHTRRGEAMRVVPKDNEAINESWLSDRDRFSHEAITHADRALKPRIKKNGAWIDTDWATAIAFAKDALKGVIAKHSAQDIGTLVGPMASAEDYLLFNRLTRGLGSNNIDHRVRQLDFSDDAARPLAPRFEAPLADIEKARSILLFGANPRMDAPILGHKVRKANKRGARVFAINSADFDFHFAVEQKLIGNAVNHISHALALAKAASELTGFAMPEELASLMGQALSSDTAKVIVDALKASQPARLIFGEHAAHHPQAALLRACAQYVSKATGASFDEIADGSNSAAAWRMGVLPHRTDAGKSVSTVGLNARQMLEQPLKAYVLAGLEMNDLTLGAQALEAIAKAECVIAFAHYHSPSIDTLAHVIFPVALPPECEGTYVNTEGTVQSLTPALKTHGDVRASWRVLRVLGEELGLSGFAFNNFDELHADVQAALAKNETQTSAVKLQIAPRSTERGLVVSALSSIYTVDSVVRRAKALQGTPIAATDAIKLHPEDALGIGVSQGATLFIGSAALAVDIDKATPKGGFIVSLGLNSAMDMPPTGSTIHVQKR